MKYNPITQNLYTNDMTFIKQLFCPYNITWDLLSKDSDATKRYCSLCQDYVYDTDGLSDIEVLQMIKNKEDACLKLSYKQENIEIGLYNG